MGIRKQTISLRLSYGIAPYGGPKDTEVHRLPVNSFAMHNKQKKALDLVLYYTRTC